MTIKRLPKRFFILLTIFIIFFLATLFFMTFDADRRVERVLFFPDEDGQQLLGELRRLPVRDDLTGNIELFVDELILGPGEIDLYRLFPEGVRLESVLYDGNAVYLGFSENLVTTAETVPLSFSGILTAVGEAVVFNFPEVKEVKTAVGGEPVEENVSNVEKK